MADKKPKRKILVEVIYYGGADRSTVADIVEQTLEKRNYKPDVYVRSASDESVVIKVPDKQDMRALQVLFQFVPQVTVEPMLAGG